MVIVKETDVLNFLVVDSKEGLASPVKGSDLVFMKSGWQQLVSRQGSHGLPLLFPSVLPTELQWELYIDQALTVLIYVLLM